MLEIGVPAPDIKLADSSGQSFDLATLRGKQRALLIFYPQDFTGGCTNQLSEVRDEITDLKSANVTPFGVNEGTASSHTRYRESLGLPFELLVDSNLEVAGAYLALKPDPENEGATLPRIQRTVYVVGKDGSVIYRARGAPPVEEILAAVNAANDGP